jgi:di/tricarboxylate transporter
LKISAQHRRLIEVVLSLKSEMLYKTVREAKFRTRFEAAIVAVQRQGARLFSRIGDIVLEPGDVLILDAGPTFVKRFQDDPNFLIVSEIARSEPPRFEMFYLALVVVTAMVVFAATLVTPYSLDLVLFTVAALGILLATGVTTRFRMYRAIDWSIIITIAAAFGLATALTNTKVAGIIGINIANAVIAAGLGQIGILAVIMVLTEVLGALITSKAAGLVMFPIAAAAAATLHIPHNKILIALMLGASDYTTPQGHQTNVRA